MVTSSALASTGDASKELLGVWKLESVYTELQETGEKMFTFGQKPRGYLVFTPEKRMVGIVTAEERKKPETVEDQAALFRSLVAYSGVYRIEGEKWITMVDASWNEVWNGTEQVRSFKVNGDRLVVIGMWQPNPHLPDNATGRAVVIWNRVRPQ